MAEQYANVTVAHHAHADRRFELLGQLAGWSRWEALGHMVELWSRCTALQTDRPSSDVILVHLGPHGEQLLVDSLFGERCDDGAIRLRGGGLTGGDVDRFSWYEPVRAQQRDAGAKRARMPGARGSGGKFARHAGPAVTSETTSAGPATTSGSPAVASASPASGFRIPDPEKISLPRAIPPSTEQTPVPAAPPATTRPASETGSPPPIPAPGKSAWHRRSGWWALMLEADARVRAAGIEPNAPPMPKACAGENERNLNACEKQLLEGGDDAETVDRKLRHLIAYRERECIRDRTRRWLSPAALWDPKRANYAYDRPLDEADKSPLARAGPKRSAARAEQPTIRPKTTDDEPPPIPSWE